MNVIVVGGGWAGLAAATEFARRGVTVTVLETSRTLGGRARSLDVGELRADNGQHLLLGAYHSVLSLLPLLDVREADVFRRLPLMLSLRDADGAHFEFAAPRLPAPLHTAVALARARGLTASDKRDAARVMLAARSALPDDRPLAEFLAAHSQGKRIVQYLWEPLCLAALNTPVAQASTVLFLSVLRAAFFGPRAASDLLLPITDLGRCLPLPAADYVTRHGGTIRLHQRVTSLTFEGDRARGVGIGGKELRADAIVLATAPRAAARLLRPHGPLSRIACDIDALGNSPICTLYLRYPRTVRLPRPFVGLLRGATQWLFDRGQLTGEYGLMAAVISAPGEHQHVDNAALIAQVKKEIARHFPDWPAPIEAKVVREKQATFAATAGCEKYRPRHSTPVRNLWLAGDYTATGFPGTLEGAVRSGIQCARLILGQDSRDEKLPAAS